MEKQDQIIIYKAEDGQATIEINHQDETVWLNQAQMVVLFDENKKTISEHINNLFNEGELDKGSTV